MNPKPLLLVSLLMKGCAYAKRGMVRSSDLFDDNGILKQLQAHLSKVAVIKLTLTGHCQGGAAATLYTPFCIE